MGRPADLQSAEESAEADTQQAFDNTGAKSESALHHKKLYRDRKNKVLGGVAGGLGSFFGIDPVIFRILFAIILFGTFGTGLFLYLILWITLPVADLEEFTGRKLYRNTEDKVFAGVAGGLAAYFDKSVIAIRLIFLAPFAIPVFFRIISKLQHVVFDDFIVNVSLGSIGSISVFVYIVLWILLPKAVTPYQKMEMRGEKVDVDRIRKHVKEGATVVKEKLKDWEKEVEQTAKEFSDKAKEGFSQTNTSGTGSLTASGREIEKSSGNIIGKIFGFVGTLIVVFFKVVFFFIIGVIALALIVTVLSVAFAGFAAWPLVGYAFRSTWQELLAWGTIFFFFLVPAIGLIIWLVRRILGIRANHNYWGWSFGALWTIGWIALILLISSLTNDFRSYQSTATTIDQVQPKDGKLTLLVSEPILENRNNWWWMHDESNGWRLDEDSIKFSFIQFSFLPSNDSLYHTELLKYSYGGSKNGAKERADKIQYSIYASEGKLDFGNGFSVAKEEKYRGQHVEVRIYVPVGKKIIFDETLEGKLTGMKTTFLRTWRNGKRQFRTMWSDFPYEAGVEYTMNARGLLADPSGKVPNYDFETEPTDSIINKLDSTNSKTVNLNLGLKKPRLSQRPI
jgi:phage shock protein PspC (stress-responsive transcriptional regulator)